MSRLQISDNTILSRYLRGSLFLMAIVTIVGVVAALIVGVSYRNALYVNSQELMDVSGAVVEKEIERLEELSLTIAVEEDLQGYLDTLRIEENLFEITRIRAALESTLLQYDPSDWYVTSIRLYDLNGGEIIAGHNPYNLTDESKEILFERSRRNKGRAIISTPGVIDNHLVISRQILKTANLSLTELGFIGIFIDFSELIRRYEGLVEGYQMTLQVYNGLDLIGSSEHLNNLDNNYAEYIPKGYKVFLMNGRRVFAALSRGTETQWSYISFIPLEELSSRIRVTAVLVLVGYALLLLLVLSLATRSVSRLTVPIRTLSRLAQNLESGNFDIAVDDPDFRDASDEVRHLHRDFKIAINRIHELVRIEYDSRLHAQDARFQVLQSQINPHFLYNTLDSINWLAKKDGNAEISGMVRSLGKLLRRSLGATSRLISLNDEIGSLKDYLKIQSIRFEESLETVFNVNEGMQDVQVPPFIFQPLVENSIHYALEEGNGHCCIEITCETADKAVQLTVVDDGPGFPDSILDAFNTGKVVIARGSGIGLLNIRERIDSLFNSASVEIGNRPTGGAWVKISLTEKRQGM